MKLKNDECEKYIGKKLSFQKNEVKIEGVLVGLDENKSVNFRGRVVKQWKIKLPDEEDGKFIKTESFIDITPEDGWEIELIE